MTDIELKPCPFCGGTAELKASHGGLFRCKEGDKPTRIYWIECSNECHIAQNFPEDVIDRWNTRK